ncbi:MAG: iron-sulfur cluster assembly accessory protein [Chloroflexi bacterium]|nr:iron-sulfur cluster assembly accessory protein [Chloroflexota bacterium]
MINLTESAAERILDIFKEQSIDSGAALRVFVKGGEGGAPQYGMAIEPQPAKTDEVIELLGVRIVVDEESLPWVIGSEIDYIDSLTAAGFTIRNPNMMGGGCACGGGACACGGGAAAASA